MSPQHPFAAVTHPDPYPYYAGLLALSPLYRDDGLGLWIACGAEAVTSVLTSPICRVRPANEPVPEALAGFPAGEIFQALVRMNDGPGHCPFKQAVSATLGSIDTSLVVEQARFCAKALLHGGDSSLPGFIFQMPVHVVASMLGVAEDNLSQTVLWTDDLVRCFAPGSSKEQVANGNAAARNLIQLFRRLMRVHETGLLANLSQQAARVGRGDQDLVLANGIGFLTQTYEATAGLIGNTVMALSRQRTVSDQLAADPSLLHQVVLEVLRYDPPVQNTRRFVIQDGLVAGQEMHVGDEILVLLASANRDPSANLDPERFDPLRKSRKSFTFGVGAHSCPGETLAITIAEVAVDCLRTSSVPIPCPDRDVAYRPSRNTRIPLLPWSQS